MPPPLRQRRHDHLVEPLLAGLRSEEAPTRTPRRTRVVLLGVLTVLAVSVAIWWLAA